MGIIEQQYWIVQRVHPLNLYKRSSELLTWELNFHKTTKSFSFFFIPFSLINSRVMHMNVCISSLCNVSVEKCNPDNDNALFIDKFLKLLTTRAVIFCWKRKLAYRSGDASESEKAKQWSIEYII